MIINWDYNDLENGANDLDSAGGCRLSSRYSQLFMCKRRLLSCPCGFLLFTTYTGWLKNGSLATFNQKGSNLPQAGV